MKTISKAQEKRNKQNRSFVESAIKRSLIGFQDRYLGAYVNWNIFQIEMRLDKAKNEGRESVIKMISTKLERKNLLTLTFITEAKENYDIKLNKLVDKVCGFGMTHLGLRVKTVKTSGSELEFLISNNEMEVHARAIWVDGTIKAPHYRFITTKRNK